MVTELHRKVALDLCKNYDTILIPTFETSQMTKKQPPREKDVYFFDSGLRRPQEASDPSGGLRRPRFWRGLLRPPEASGLRYLSTHLQLADLFTKALSAVTFLRLITPILSGGIVDTSDEEE